MSKLFLSFFLLLNAHLLFAMDYNSHPCRDQGSASSIDLFNSDDLFFAGRFLSRNFRAKEGIECLNRAKLIAPAYIDVRLELMNAFHNIGDKRSALKESYSLKSFELDSYYYGTYLTYLTKINRLDFSILPQDGYKYIEGI